MGRPILRVALLLAPAGLAAGVACTSFNGVVATRNEPAEAGADVAPPDETGAPDASDAAPPPPAYLSAPEAARLCSLAFACPELPASVGLSLGVLIDPNNFSLCMDWASGPLPPMREGLLAQRAMLACMADAGACAGAGACALFEELSPGDPRCTQRPDAGPDASSARCLDGVTKIDCSALYAFHCNNGQFAPGSTCNVGNDGVPWCTVGGLDAGCPPFNACAGTFEDFCGTDGLHFRLDCALRGTICALDDAGNIGCGGDICTAYGTQCAGAVVQVCDGEEQSPFDCSSLGGTCSAQDNTFTCVRPGDACTVNDPDINVCTGTSISLCVGGQKSSFDCATVGKACVPGVLPQTPHCG